MKLLFKKFTEKTIFTLLFSLLFTINFYSSHLLASPKNKNSLIFAQTVLTGEWANTTWGMSELEVKNLFPKSQNVAPRSQEYTSALSDSINIEEFNFNVIFAFKDNKLESVSLIYNGSDHDAAFIKSSQLLINKYGIPSLEKEETINPKAIPLISEQKKWLLSKSEIEVRNTYFIDTGERPIKRVSNMWIRFSNRNINPFL